MLLLNENVGEILHDLELGKKFSETIAKDRSGKEKNDKLCFIKIKITVFKKKHYLGNEKTSQKLGENIC